MNLTTLINLLNQAPDVNNRSVLYKDKLRDLLHPLFLQIIADYQGGALQLVNNSKLNEIRIHLDDLFQKMNEDLEPIGSIITQLGKAANSLEVAPDDYSELPAVLQTANTLHSEAVAMYNQALAFYAEHGQIAEHRRQFNIGNPESQMYAFVMHFDIQLERDMAMIQFLRDTLTSYNDKLKAIRSKIGQLIASNNNPPPVEIAPIVSLLNQSDVINTRATQIVGVLQEARTKLYNLGQGLIKKQIDIRRDELLSQTKTALDGLIAAAPSESVTHDALLNQLTAAANGFTTTHGNPDLPAAITLAGTRRQQAKTVHENAHLLKLAFTGLDVMSKKLDDMEATTEERAFYSDYRKTIDKFDLLTLYIESTCDKFKTSTIKLEDVFAFFYSDQRNKVQLFDDKLPFALLPVRLETRFMTIKHVRDNISYASFSDVLRKDQDAVGIKAVKEQNTLRESTGPKSGILLQSAPVSELIPDQHELWLRIYPDNIAIHTHETQLSQSEFNDAQIYWNENWKAAGIPAYELGAWRSLCSSYGSQRAAWVISQTTPTNSTSKPPNATGTPPLPLTALTTLPALPTLTLRPASWSQKPQTKVMPERFVARVYSNNTWREIVGQKIPSPLPVGFDPMDPYINYLDQTGTEINMPPELRWLTHFGEAEKVGMGIRIPLQTHEIGVGFDRLLVLGLKLDLNAAAASQELETLLNNHHYATGLALVPQGTPTNNTEETKSGFAGIEPGYEESFKTELGSNQFSTTTSHYDKADGQRLAEALGVNSSIFQHIANSNTFDVQESMAMTRALWPSTLGYYLKNMIAPAIVQSNISDTRTFFTNYVHGRGLIPAFRVRNQPYGVLTSTVYSKWKYSDSTIYEAKLHTNILEKLRRYWLLHFCDQVERVGFSTTPANEQLINILGLHPNSVQFHQRITVGSILTSNMAQFMAAANLLQPNPPIANPSAEVLLNTLYTSYVMESFSYFNSPRIFSMAFAQSHRLLNGPVIDSLPLSEKRTIENLGNGFANYIEWLAGSAISYIRAEDFTNTFYSPSQQLQLQPPKALLYLLLRHAWMLEYLDTAHCLLTSVNAISKDAWHNHQFLKMTGENTPEAATAEQKSMLHGFVKAEVQYENELQIEAVMRNLSTNQQYLASGMTPEQFHLFLRDQSMPLVEETTASRYEDRLGDYHVEQGQWSYVMDTYDQVSTEHSVGDHIRANLNSGGPCYAKLKEINEALAKLSTLPTARLERCLAEHLDTCTYRLDSWLNGLVTKRLHEQRSTSPNGIYLGAYGILENPAPGDFPGVHVVNISNADSWNSAVASKGQRKMLALTRVDQYPTTTSGIFITSPIPATQPASFIYLGNDPTTTLIEDPESGKIVSGQQSNPDNNGFILAPSLNHAVAAAVMRAGYAAHSLTPGIAEKMAVTLNSDRVRTAMYYLDGIRNGQSLGAMLGYRFERGLHERQTTTSSLDVYIYKLRDKFPLVAGSVIPTPGGSSNNNAQTRHVTDGLKLLAAYAKLTSPFWHTGITGLHNGTSLTADGTKINEEILKIKGDLDAIGDLLLSEAIYQVTRGNHERAGSVLQALGYAGNIPEPEIIKTPRRADTFTHRCAVQFTPSTTANASWAGASARANAEPALNNWLASQLPSPVDIRIVYDFAGNTSTLSADMVDLDLQPIDLLAIFSSSGSNQSADATELSKRIIYYVRTNHTLADTVEIAISYGSRSGLASTQRTIFELTPILQSLSRIAGNSRMLNPDDFVTPGALAAMSAPAGALNSAALYSRISVATSAFQTTVSSLNTAIAATPATGFTGTQLNALRNSLINAAQFGVSTAIPDTVSAITTEARNELVGQADRTYKELNKRLSEITPKMSAIAATPTTSAGHKERVTELIEIAKLLFGRAFRVFTDFTLHNLQEVQNASSYTTLLSDAGPFPVEAWMSGVARVRPRMGEYHKQMLLAESVRYNPTATSAFEYTKQSVFQFPVVDTTTGNDRWIGMKLPAAYKIPLDAISMVIESDGVSSTIPTCGMVIDEWPEQIPIDQVTAGIAINYDQPSSEAPQSIILAVTPEVKNYWLWDDLMDTLNETIEMAKIRAVEPDMIQKSHLSQVLPALVAQMNGDGTNTSPSLDFARNIVDVPNGFNGPIDRSVY